ncbi:TetR/AcrR family transcriptional regulator [Paenibacillus sp. MER 99-2]|uniref:TetR/AcrR family transcriptional regulator n=1 Tax=Paenibacillus sp. MER 99-2 TaxID=2939572 RepID=UPI00203B571F|nr:TetR/AcrR family transcriptional regulator [Paenibacillus sp. MER 99-2]MCM3173652.1 TetR/AcrR family transcriptional regulator [Paenibacillus sp. MER 99-2]
MSNKKRSIPDGDVTAYIATPAPEKALRADAQKNRDKLLHVAHTIFATEGIAVSMDEIARRAGVGVGTVYRHFPTKEDLFGAVIYRHKMRLMEEADRLLHHDNPGDAFFQYFTKIIDEGIANKAITDALVSTLTIEAGSSELANEFWQGITRLLEQAQQHGSVRADVSIEDIKIMLIGVLQATGARGVFPDRVVSILCDGLRR